MAFKEPFKPKWKSPLGDFESQVDLGVSSLSKPPTPPIPDVNPFRVGLERRPPITAADKEAGAILADMLENGRKLSGVGIQVAADEVTERVTVAALGKGIATAVGVVAVPFVAADLFDALAPGVKSWLLGGWAGQSGMGLPLQAPILVPGQGNCTTDYGISVEVKWGNAENGFQVGSTATRGDVFRGPIQSVGVQIDGAAGYIKIVDRDGVQLRAGFSTGGVSQLQANQITIEEFARKDGLPDNCLPAPGPPTPDPIVQSPNPAPGRHRPPTVDSPPLSQNLPSTKALSELFNNPTNLPSPVPSPSNPEAPNPSSQEEEEPEVDPSDYRYPVAPPNPTPPLEEVGTCDPCQLAIGKKLDELREKLEEQGKDEDDGETGDCKTYPFVYSYVVCNSGELSLEQRTILLAQEPTSQLRAEFDNMLALAAKGCSNDAVAAIPDWWQVRIGADRSQIVVAFRKADSRTYHQIAIPHPVSSQKWTENLLGDYRKGPWSGVLTLKDNSKFIINCETRAEAQRMVGRAKLLIRPDMQFSPSTEQFTERKGNAVGVATMRGRQAYYFPTGQKDAKPEWRAQFG